MQHQGRVKVVDLMSIPRFQSPFLAFRATVLFVFVFVFVFFFVCVRRSWKSNDAATK